MGGKNKIQKCGVWMPHATFNYSTTMITWYVRALVLFFSRSQSDASACKCFALVSIAFGIA